MNLLLHLIEKNKIDIYDIPIVEITDQYLEAMSRMEMEDLDIVSDFLLMAATLLEIKSRMLLPKEEEEEGENVDPRQELVERLLLFKKFKARAGILASLDGAGDRSFMHDRQIPKEVSRYIPPIDLAALLAGTEIQRLTEALEDIVQRRNDAIDEVRSRFGVIKREKISLQGRIRDVLSYALQHKSFSFSHMVRRKRDKIDVVVSFLAVLELMKMGRITLKQEKPFSDMEIEVVNQDNADMPDHLDLSGVEDM